MTTQQAGNYGYVCFYKGKRHEVYAPSSYAALCAAQLYFRTTKGYEVTVVLCERPDGSQVEHTAA